MKTCKCGEKHYCNGLCKKCYNAAQVKIRGEKRRQINEMIYLWCWDRLRNNVHLRRDPVTFAELTDYINERFGKSYTTNKIVWILTKNNKPHWLIKEKVCELTYLSYDWSVEK